MKEVWIIKCGKCKNRFISEDSPASGITTNDKPTYCPYCGLGGVEGIDYLSTAEKVEMI